jgi:catechol 2,3-dioxygenase-like lactoylglutathione lyase family enzyme
MNFMSVVLNVSNLDRSIEFYRDVFGFTLLSRMDRIAAVSAADSERSQVLVLRTPGTTGHVGGAHHIGARAFMLEVDSVDQLERIRQALDGTGGLVGKRDTRDWSAVVGHDPDRIAVVAGCSLRADPIRDDDWTNLDELLYGLGE